MYEISDNSSDDEQDTFYYRSSERGEHREALQPQLRRSTRARRAPDFYGHPYPATSLLSEIDALLL